MWRSLTSTIVPTGLVIGVLLIAGTRPGAGDAARLAAPPTEPAPATGEPTTTSSAPTTTAPPPSTRTTTTTTTTTVATPTAPSTSTTLATAPEPPRRAVPVSSITASQTIVGAGGQVEFTGACAVDAAVFVRVTGTTTDLVDTGLAGAGWTYTWTAPTDPALISSFEFEFWCGDPSGADRVYPAALLRRVDVVASRATPTTTVDPAGVTLPATD